MKTNFIEKVLQGLEFEDAISQYVEIWHQSDSDLELHDYLGLTFDEYALWVENPNALGSILYHKKTGENVNDADWPEIHLLAARSQSQQDSENLKEWLRSKAYL